MKNLKIGRSSSNDIVLNDSTVSSVHACLSISESGSVTLKDLNSKNGTYVNGHLIHDAVILKSGDKVKLGNYNLDWLKLLTDTGGERGEGGVIPPNTVEKVTVGRNPECRICFSQREVSGLHATLARTSNGEIHIVDNGSTNGTYVNGRKVKQQMLIKGDVVTLANKYPFRWDEIFKEEKKEDPTPPFGWGKWVAALAAVLLLSGGAYYWFMMREQPLKPEQIYASYKKSVGLIYQTYIYKVTVKDTEMGEMLGNEKYTYWGCNEEGKPVPGEHMGGFGTGFFVSSDGKIITNKHVVQPWVYMPEQSNTIKNYIQRWIQVQAASSRMAQVQWLPLVNEVKVEGMMLSLGIALNDTYVSTVDDFIPCNLYKVSADDKIDVAVIQVKSKTLPQGVDKIVNLNDPITEEDMDIGKKIFTLGFPQSFTLGATSIGLEANNQSGEITQHRGEIEFGHNITIHQGASGSPVFNEYGRFTGVIVSGFLGISQGYNQAVKARYAAELVK